MGYIQSGYKSGLLRQESWQRELYNADALSHLPLPGFPSDVPTPLKTAQLMELLAMAPVLWR